MGQRPELLEQVEELRLGVIGPKLFFGYFHILDKTHLGTAGQFNP